MAAKFDKYGDEISDEKDDTIHDARENKSYNQIHYDSGKKILVDIHSVESQQWTTEESSFISLYGRNRNNESVTIDVVFYTWFYFELPRKYLSHEVDGLVEEFRSHFSDEQSAIMHDIQYVEKPAARPYQFGKLTHLLKIIFIKNSDQFTAQKFLQDHKELDRPRGHMRLSGQLFEIHLFETGVRARERWCSTQLNSSGLMKTSNYELVNHDFDEDYKRHNLTKIHIRTSLLHLEMETDPVELGKFPKATVLAFDIETGSLDCRDHVARVLGISCWAYSESTGDLQGYYLTWNWHRSLNIPNQNRHHEKFNEIKVENIKVFNYADEKACLYGFIKFFMTCDPDYLIGHNSYGFDLEYLIVRGLEHGIKAFGYMGKNGSKNGKVKDKINSRSVAYYDLPGRVHVDTLYFLSMFDEGQSDFRLETCCITHLKDIEDAKSATTVLDKEIFRQFGPSGSDEKFFLTRDKGDIPGSEILDYFQSEEYKKRHELAIYCLKDSLITLRLFVGRTMFLKAYKMGQVFRAPIQVVLTGGAQDRVMPQMLYEMHRQNILYNRYHIDSLDPHEKLWKCEDYIGGKVRTPVPGKYRRPVAVMDFGGMYPSIMMHYFLCMASVHLWRWVTAEQRKWLIDNKIPHLLKKVGEEMVLIVQDGTGFSFVIQRMIKKNRDVAKQKKEDCKSIGDYVGASIHDCDQLALKIYMNGMYGLFAVKKGGKFSFPIIAEMICQFGRELSDQACVVVKNHPLLIQYHPEIIYGDTDSLFIYAEIERSDFKTEQEYIDFCFDIYTIVCEAVTADFKSESILVNLEKLFYPLCLYKKKKYYIARSWMAKGRGPNKKANICGVESKKRDRCPDLRNLQIEVIDQLVSPTSTDIEMARTIHDHGMKVARGEIKIDGFVIIKQMGKSIEEFKGEQPHLTVAKNNRDRGNVENCKAGVRIGYIIFTDKNKSEISKVSDYAEDFQYASSQKMKIDTYWYLSKHYFNCLLKLVSITTIDLAKVFQEPLAIAKINSMIGQSTLDCDYSIFSKSKFTILEKEKEKKNSEKDEKDVKDSKDSKVRDAKEVEDDKNNKKIQCQKDKQAIQFIQVQKKVVKSIQQDLFGGAAADQKKTIKSRNTNSTSSQQSLFESEEDVPTKFSFNKFKKR